jgi:hypothetical protein
MVLGFTLMASVPSTESYVVMGSFQNPGSAKKQATQLSAQLGIDLSVTSSSSKLGLLHRIVSGPHEENKAQAIKVSVARAGLEGAWIWRNQLPRTEVPEQLPLQVQPVDEAKIKSTESSGVVAALQSSRPGDYSSSQTPVTGSMEDEDMADSAEPRSWSLRGYIKSYGLAQEGVEIDDAPPGLVDDKSLYQSQNAIRMMFEGSPSEVMAWQLHYELTPIFYSSAVEANPLSTSTLAIGTNSYRISDIDPVLGTATEKSATLNNLDRLNLQLRLEPGDLTIGRQAISFGSARVINPTDVFLPFEVQTLNQEYRIGVDAVRFQQPLGELGELDMGIILGEDARAENSAVFIQALNNISGMDLHGTVMRFSDQNLAGFGIQSALGNFGFWFEAAHVWNGDEYTRASTGLDYSFSENVFGMLEYHYNGAGSDSPEEYLDLFDDFAYQKGGVFLLGQNYIIPSVSWTASALLSISIQAIVNLDDSSAFVNLAGDYSVSDNLYSSFGVYVFTGDRLEFITDPPNVMLGSEYGINPNLLYLSLRYYF